MPVALPETQQQLWESYLAAESRGTREAKLCALDAFVEELLRLPAETWKRWALELAASIVDEGADVPVRHALFERILFPALAEALGGQAPGCARWLAGFAQQLYRLPACRERLGSERSTEWGLLQTALSHDPTDSRSRQQLIGLFERRLRYTLHELPAGVLYGHNGATATQCDELLAELDEFRALIAADNRATDFAVLVADCDGHFRGYKQYLLERPKYRSYAEYLELHAGSAT